MAALFIDARLDDGERRQKLYAGDIFVVSPTASTLALIALARELLEKAFKPYDPRMLHKHMSPEKVAEVLARLKPSFTHHPECKRLLPMIMRDVGGDVEKLFFDVPRLRSAYPKHFLSSGIAYAYHPHRDTWYSAPMSQINWWLPVYPVDPNNAMGFFPEYFDKPIKNNSEAYNYYEWNATSRPDAAQHVRSDTRQQPKPQQDLNASSLCCLPPPGAIILFSGAHLHETVPNATDVARYSIDFRTVHIDDVAAHRGAPNLDSRSTGTTMRDFVCAADGQPIPHEIVRLYDDETANSAKVLRFPDTSGIMNSEALVASRQSGEVAV